MAAEIDCVAVTDHNTGEWIDRLKAAYADMKREADAGILPTGFREISLFPGVEISVQGGFHLLAVFDPSATSQTISDLLAKVDYDGTRGDSDGVTREGAAKVVAHIIVAGGLAIPAHVEGDKGLLQMELGTRKCLLDTTTVKQVLQEAGILALEWTSSSSPRPAVLDEMKMQFASVVGSDCHNFQGRAVPGSRYTWVKMTKPSLEGLRLALLDGQEVSVRRSDESDGFAPFNTPEHFIRSIEIREARYMGRGKLPISLHLNPYFNALIGSRGTGKSTIVHALRLAYRRENELSPNSESGQTFSRFNKVAKTRSDEGGLRADTVIHVEVQRDGMSYRLVWGQDGESHAVDEWDPAAASFRLSISQAVTEQRFPVRLFSQGQIAALAGDSQQALLKVIDDAAGTQSRHATFEEARRSFLVARAQMRELAGKLLGRESLSLSLQDIQRKLARFEGADYATVLTSYQRARLQNQEIERRLEASVEMANRLKEHATGMVPEDLPDGLFDTEDDALALNFVNSLNSAIDTARQGVERSAAALGEQRKVLCAEIEASPWFAGIRAAQAAYLQLKADLQETGVNNPSEYGRLLQEKQRLDSELKSLDSLQKQHGEGGVVVLIDFLAPVLVYLHGGLEPVEANLSADGDVVNAHARPLWLGAGFSRMELSDSPRTNLQVLVVRPTL